MRDFFTSQNLTVPSAEEVMSSFSLALFQSMLLILVGCAVMKVTGLLDVRRRSQISTLFKSFF
jgi:hypothetical protein